MTMKILKRIGWIMGVFYFSLFFIYPSDVLAKEDFLHYLYGKNRFETSLKTVFSGELLHSPIARLQHDFPAKIVTKRLGIFIRHQEENILL